MARAKKPVSSLGYVVSLKTFILKTFILNPLTQN